MAVFPGGAKFIQNDATADRPHIFGFKVPRTVVDDPLLEVWDGPTVASRRFYVTQEGDVIVEPATSRLRFPTAAALGGGATATLGTTGGQGPAVAAQNEWLLVERSTGATRRIPAWA